MVGLENKMYKNKKNILLQIDKLIDTFYFEERNNEPSKKIMPYAGRVFDEKEIKAGVHALLESWLTWGQYGEKLEIEMANKIGVKYALGVNSGSSANLIAFASLFSSELDNPLKVGDEVITVAASFPTTVNPIIQYQCIPVFVDIELGHYTASAQSIEKAITKNTKAIMMAHTLGVPFDIDAIVKICKKYRLYLIEDNCDALGSQYMGKWTGSFGDVSTLSMYPAHHITMGEGGFVFTDNARLYKIMKSLRDWGRDCWCQSGKDNSCQKRFGWQLGKLPKGYDHKYTYSHIGYNLKPTDVQAAIGLEQLKKLDGFISKRKHNWNLLKNGLKHLEKYLILPESPPLSDPSWFAFMITVKDESPVTKECIVTYLEKQGIQTRPLFAGNLLQQPAYQNVRYKINESLINTDKVMRDGFFIGVYPGLNPTQVEFMLDCFKDLFKNK